MSCKLKEKKLLITIDGPAGAGKTTVARMLAEKLGYKYIDTGALYRGVAYKAFVNNIETDNESELRKLCSNIDLQFVNNDKGSCLFLDGKDISDHIRTSKISMLASAVSAKPFVREALFNLQKKLGQDKCAVFEGRDMGTVVFPDADLKFFLDAKVKIRAKRRYKEFSLNSNKSQTLDNIEKDIIIRDKNDKERKIAPLKQAKDAIIIDSGGLTIQKVVEKMLSFL
jgi:CMP/dCMP kinase